MAARAGVEPTTLQLRVIASTKAPQCPIEGAIEVICNIYLKSISHFFSAH